VSLKETRAFRSVSFIAIVAVIATLIERRGDETQRASSGDERGLAARFMTALEALAILEAAVLECKKRNINTPEVREALNLLERYVRPAWLMLQFRHHALKERPAKYVERKVQQQVLLATFPGIRDSVKELIGKRMVTLALEFHDTHNMNVKNEIERLAKEYGKLKEPWVLQAAVMKSHASIRISRELIKTSRARGEKVYGRWPKVVRRNSPK
jgi:hypothetical protein